MTYCNSVLPTTCRVEVDFSFGVINGQVIEMLISIRNYANGLIGFTILFKGNQEIISKHKVRNFNTIDANKQEQFGLQKFPKQIAKISLDKFEKVQ